MYDDFEDSYCHVCGGVDWCDEVAHDMAADADENGPDRCYICGEVDECDESAHAIADEEPYAYDDEPTYDPWRDERYTFMTTDAPF